MKGKFVRTMMLIVGMLAFGVVTKAEGRGAIKLTVPFAFVVDGETLPAGTYTLSRVGDDKLDGLVLRNETTRASVFLHPIEVADASSDKPEVSFKRVGGAYFLKTVRTSNDVYDIPVELRSVPEELARMHQPTGSSAGSAGR